MTREQAKNNLIAIGIAEPTDEQISNYLNQVGGETKKEKDKADRYKADADKFKLDAEDLQSKIDEFNEQNMSEIEKANKRAEEAERRAAEAEKATAELAKAKLVSDITSVFANGGLSGEIYSGVIKALANSGDAKMAMKEAQTFVSGVSEAKTKEMESAKASWEKELLDKTQDPGANSDPNANIEPEKEESYAAQYAKQYSAKMNPVSNNKGDNAPVNF